VRKCRYIPSAWACCSRHNRQARGGPAFFADSVSSIASAVEFPPVPAMIGMRPCAWATAARITSLCSSKFTVGTPRGADDHDAVVPCSTWKSMSDLKRS